ncbi:protein kinase, partial [Nonomuraea sp. NPDC050783]|uniref:serine/threonine-protein kinase n=1 Tax=Nonomuraea sp. NPDC050783 TaxID=3154634 RepID=UPI0034650AD7
MGVPGYTEIRELGRGGTGRVMLAVRDSDGLEVAIKYLARSLRDDPEFAGRFRDEADLLAEIDSPHVARLIDYTELPGDAVIVMELVNGVPLRRLLEREGRTGAEVALVVLKGALLGLAEAHRHGVAHRDLKPENVLVTQDGDSKLVDFGVVARPGEEGGHAGTPAYTAPEQRDGVPAGPATDVYAATAVFFECLTGHRPFPGDDATAPALQHRRAAPALEEVEEALRPLVARGLAEDPADRPASAEELLAELEDVAPVAYGDDWEERGRAGLGLLLVPLVALLPRSRPAAGSAAAACLAAGTLTPARRFVVTGGLVLATTAAVASAFVLLRESSATDSGLALPPVTAVPALTSPPGSPATDPGAILPGTAPSGTAPSGTAPSGTAPSGALPGTALPGTAPSGALPGTALPGTAPSGALPGTALPGTAPS